MKVGITGTPGTGKSAVCEILQKYYPVIDLNQLIEEKKFYTEKDRERNTLVADTDALVKYVLNYSKGVKQTAIFEGHLAHYLPLDLVIVLRASPSELRRRLSKKGFDEAKIKENVEAEALDVILIEALERHENVHEIDTSEKDVTEVVNCIVEIINGSDKYRPGSIDWSGELFG
ncbi:MAG: adenylate kinase family protein [Methanocellales archaeon]|nr:adenylate kinase family protein [Methanocellales archaeon]MDD4898822.1 adenylate kinase family protein [Methanocellales archaeon]